MLSFFSLFIGFAFFVKCEYWLKPSLC